jgi:small nuclear ribonucleoprotein (snRNP)-like protein
MFGKTLTVTLTILLLNLAAAEPVRARAAQETAASAVENIKAEVGKLGAGTPVTLKLTNGTKLTGKVGEADDEGFMVLDSKGSRTRVSYSEVKSVKRFKKSGWKTFEPKDVAFVAGLFGGIFLLAIWAANQTR